MYWKELLVKWELRTPVIHWSGSGLVGISQCWVLITQGDDQATRLWGSRMWTVDRHESKRVGFNIKVSSIGAIDAKAWD